MLPGSAAIAPEVTDSIASTSAAVRPPVVPLSTTAVTDAVTVSVRSGSRSVRVPLVVRPAPVSVRSAVARSPLRTRCPARHWFR